MDGGATILTYTDLNGLRATSAHYLRHDDERRALAQRAQTHVYAHHTYDHRAAKFDELLQSLG